MRVRSGRPSADADPRASARPGGVKRHFVRLAALTLLLAVAAPGAQAPLGGPDSAAPESDQEIRAQLTPRHYTTLSSKMAARIDRITTRVGERFKKGDLLVAFDCAPQKAQLAHAHAVLTQAEKTFVINQRLMQLKSTGQLELDIAAAEVEKAKADRAAADAAVAKCTIIAPFEGITVEQKAGEFQYTNAGQPLLDILDDQSFEVELIAPSRWLAWLKPGMPFKVDIHETEKTYSAQVMRLSGRVDPVSQTIKVIGEITQTAPELMAGMSGRVVITPPNGH
ncbi:MAG: efflux RND transporter periplasmic adaptor subunit [Bradyrhizobium sp.]|uniref:efflux RND transporter periplasmic adaptor subunit n=1 Tax=Bradyrhizobium sp. TaxID=376 RepID=UPI003C7D51B7